MSIDWRRAPSLSALRAFDATARNDGFAGAARALNVTHAAVAQQVRALERHLGVSLAVRQGRRVRLTEAGQRLARALDDGFGAIARCLEELEGSGTRRALRITATPFLFDYIIMPRMSEFWAEHPGAEISMHPVRRYVDILKDGMDLAIRAVADRMEADWQGVDAVRIARVPLIAIAAPKLAGAGRPDPASLPWLWHDGMGSKLVMMENAGLNPDRLARARIGSPNLQLEAVRQGLGVTIFNERIARRDIEAGRIVEVPLPRKQYADYYAVTPKGPRHPLSDPFVAWVGGLL